MAPAKQVSRSAGSIGATALAVAAVVAAAAAFFAYKDYFRFQSPVLRLLKAPKLTELAEFDASYKDRMLWGSYRSGLYFGMRTRTPKGLQVGLIWFDPDDPNTLNQMRVRHEASQGDGLASYGWTRHDGRSYGEQSLVDGEYNISVSMLKSFGPESGPGGDWSLRLGLARSREGAAQGRRRRVSVVLYVGDEDTPKEPWQVLPDGEVADLRQGGPHALLTGASSALGRGAARWALHALEQASSRSRGCRLDYLALGTESKDYLLRVRDLMLSTMWERLERQPSSNRFHLYLPNGATTSSDLALFQMTCPVGGEGTTLDIAFTSSSTGAHGTDPLSPSDRVNDLVGPALGAALEAKRREFDDRFDRIFGAGLKAQQQQQGDGEGWGDGSGPSPSPSLPEGTLEASRAALSNLLGSIGYFYGSSLVRTGPRDAPPSSYPPAALFTAVPSRSFFPRGFLWDEGFHQLLVQKWDPQLSRDIIAHWLDLMNAQGWIPREQILGEEARSRVPPEFVVQDPAHANPPSLFLPIANMAAQLVAARGREERAQAQGEDQGQQQLGAGAGGVGKGGGGGNGGGDDVEELARVSAFLRRAWPRLEAWYGWFNSTQAGPLPTSYRWHGRDPAASSELNPKTLTSGLDDFPRASHPDATERHLDLRCWMALAARAMHDIGSSLGLPPAAVSRYAADAAALSELRALQDLHWDEARGWFADWGTHTEDVALEIKTVSVPPEQPGGAPSSRRVSQRVTRGWPLPQHVPQYGYVALFPLIMGLLPGDNDKVPTAATVNATAADGDASSAAAGGRAAAAASSGGPSLTLQQIGLLTDPGLLWSPHGLRSLAASASLYKARNTADDPPYWRGQIWINVNYLVLRALARYGGISNAAQGGARADGEVARAARAAHDELRRRLLETVVGGYRRQGYLYEQYDDESGRGTSSHPFTGWTALITLIAAQEY